ncbi:MAG: hypothetical protein F7C38_05945 [Desulfurococcales archaeon]|nr:hypothetical protein [Desulfurococcales archaeon]
MGAGEVRLVYSSISLYVSLLWRMATSILYTIVVARRLNIGDYALLGLSVSFSMLFSLPVNQWAYWAQRAIARRAGSGVGSTGLLLTLLYSLASLPLYIAVAWVESVVLGYGFRGLLLAVPLVVAMQVHVYLGSITSVTMPSRFAGARIAGDTVKLLAALTLVTYLGYKYPGAIAALTLSTVTSMSIMLLLTYRRGMLRGGFEWPLAKSWIRGFYTPLARNMIGILRSLMRPIVSWVTGNPASVAYLHVGLSAETPLLQAGSYTATPLYSRALRKPSGDDVGTSLGLYLIFAGFIAAVLTGMAKPVVTTFNPAYIGAWPVMVLVTVYAFLFGVIGIYRSALIALDTSDRKGLATGYRTFMTRILEANIAAMLVAYTAAVPLMWVYRGDALAPVAILLSSFIAVYTVLLAYYHRLLSKRLDYRPPHSEVAGLVLALAASYSYYYYSGAYSIVVTSFLRDVWGLILHIAVSGVIFYTIMLAVSPLARRILRRGFLMLSG